MKKITTLSLSKEDVALLLSFKTDEKTYIDILRKVLKNNLFFIWLVNNKPELFTQLWIEYLKSQNQQQAQQPTQNEVKPNA